MDELFAPYFEDSYIKEQIEMKEDDILKYFQENKEIIVKQYYFYTKLQLSKENIKEDIWSLNMKFAHNIKKIKSENTGRTYNVNYRIEKYDDVARIQYYISVEYIEILICEHNIRLTPIHCHYNTFDHELFLQYASDPANIEYGFHLVKKIAKAKQMLTEPIDDIIIDEIKKTKYKIDEYYLENILPSAINRMLACYDSSMHPSYKNNDNKMKLYHYLILQQRKYDPSCSIDRAIEYNKLPGYGERRIHIEIPNYDIELYYNIIINECNPFYFECDINVDIKFIDSNESGGYFIVHKNSEINDRTIKYMSVHQITKLKKEGADFSRVVDPQNLKILHFL